jgi:hypothetical protein
MRLNYLMVAAILAGTPVIAQDTPSSSTDANSSSPVDAGESKLPVSIDRIRDALVNPPAKPLIREGSTPDFEITVEERAILENFFKPEDFKVGPVPAGGLYAYEQQQILSNKVDQPLTQPYAAFSGGELVTLAIQGLLFRYLGQQITDGLGGAQRAADEAAARDTVMKAIQTYCAAQPGHGAAIEICSAPASPR